jgi:ferredoxin
MDCISNCKHGAVHFAYRYRSLDKLEMTGGGLEMTGKDKLEMTKKEKSPDEGRRAFLTTSVMVATAATLKAQEMKVDGGLAAISNAQKPCRNTPIVPAGAKSLKNFSDHCTACQLCVSVCPNQVLRPSTDLETLMQPEMSYERGYCRPECTKCSQVCPAGAIRPITKEEKSSIQIGHAVVNLDLCVVNTDDVKCGNCARHCPVGAIRMVRKNKEDKNSLSIPTVNEERCIGCGACENLCPVRPVTAIHVEGHEVHREL